MRQNLTEGEVKQAAKELFSGGGESVFVMCQDHMYCPSKKGIEGTFLQPPLHFDCPKCNEAYLLTYFAKLPPSIRMQRLDELEQAIHHAVELDSKGLFDFRPDRRPKIEISEE